MKRVFLIVTVISILCCGCGETSVVDENVIRTIEESTTAITKEETTNRIEEPTSSVELSKKMMIEESDKEEDLFETLFSEFDADFLFCSGAGAWHSRMLISPDGSFEGDFIDSDMGDERYSRGCEYQCSFTGKLATPSKIDDFTYSTHILEINLENEPETTEDRFGLFITYTEPYGLDDADEILIYLPGTPIKDLPDEFLNWVQYNGGVEEEPDRLSTYCLNNVNNNQGWSLTDVISREDDSFGEYLLYNSDNMYYMAEDFKSSRLDFLRYALNEIYAKHGRRFNDKDLQSYFDSMSWYEPRYSPEEFDQYHTDEFNEFEKSNIRLLRAELDRRKAEGEIQDDTAGEYDNYAEYTVMSICDMGDYYECLTLDSDNISDDNLNEVFLMLRKDAECTFYDESPPGNLIETEYTAEEYVELRGSNFRIYCPKYDENDMIIAFHDSNAG